MGLQELGLSIRLVEASDLPENACGMSQFDTKAGMGEIDVLRSDEYVNRPGCLDGVDGRGFRARATRAALLRVCAF